VRYRTIVADPPWHYDDYATMPGNAGKKGHTVKRPDMPYGSLTVDEIGALSPPADPSGCRFFLWTTNKYLPFAFSVLTAWGAEYKQTLVWHKTGNPSPFGGSVAPNHAEFLLVAERGNPELLGRLTGSVIAARKPYAHSQKPECFLDHVEAVSPAPYLEMFSRRARLGWDTWGDESLEHVQLGEDAA
jgi:N6-adenosine-specific RNA methylase IME4